MLAEQRWNLCATRFILDSGGVYDNESMSESDDFVVCFFFSLTSRNIIIELGCFIRGGIHGAVSHEQSAENGTDVSLGRNSSQSCTSIYFIGPIVF